MKYRHWLNDQLFELSETGRLSLEDYYDLIVILCDCNFNNESARKINKVLEVHSIPLL